MCLQRDIPEMGTLEADGVCLVRNFCGPAAVGLESPRKSLGSGAEASGYFTGGSPSEASSAVGYMEITRWTCVMVSTPFTMGLQAASRRVPPVLVRREKDFTIWPITA